MRGVVSVGLLGAGLMAVAPAPPAAAAVAPNGTYSNWTWPASSGYYNMDERLTVINAGAHYFWSHQFGFVGGDVGYIGLQNGSYPNNTKIALYSVWGANAAEGPNCGPFVEGSPGYTCRLDPYNWVTGRAYRLRIWANGTDSQGEWWEGWVQDTVTGTDTYIGRIRVPTAWGWLTTGSVSFTEYFGPQVNLCSQFPWAKAQFDFPTANAGTVQISSHVPTVSSTGNCPAYSRIYPQPGADVHEMGHAIPVTVSRVDSSATVTPDSTGRVTIPYCPDANPCQFSAVPADVVVTGRSPIGGPGIAANLVAYGRTTTAFTLRALNQSGNPITSPVVVYYHAQLNGTPGTEEDRTVSVTPNSSGYATVNYANPVAGVVPTAVVASGVSPDGGPDIPVSLVVSSKTATGFTVRALNQSGAAIASNSITLSYFAAWTGYLDPGSGGVSVNGTTAVTTDSSGYATVTFGQALPSAPTGMVASGVSPSAGGSIAASLVVDTPSTTGFRVRVLNQNGAVVASQSVTLSYHAVAGAAG